MFNVPEPLLVITKVLEETEAKSVLFKVEVEVEPWVMLLPLPETEIEAVGAVIVVKLDTTPPGVTQFEAVPVKAILVSVPLIPFPEASVNVVTVALLLAAKPWLK